MDFASLPPEINSARMYSGAGATPLVSASAAWAELSSTLFESAASIGSTVTGLAAAWMGPSSLAMTHSVTSYAQWLTSTALSAERTAAQASAAVAAYETAFAATVPPPLIDTNRLQLAVYVSTNILGQNTAAIMATEALYAEMWAQDVAAMVGYSASSQAATSALPQFMPAPQTTNPAGLAAQAAATTQATATASSNPILQFLQTLIPGFTPGQPLQNLAALLTSSFGSSLIEQGFVGLDPVSGIAAFLALTSLGESTQAINIATGAAALPTLPTIFTPAISATGAAAPVTAISGSGNVIGGLSVPPGWAQQRGPSMQERGPLATPLDRPESPGLAGLAGMGGLGGLAGMRGTPTKQQRPQPQYGVAPSVMPKHPYGG